MELIAIEERQIGQERVNSVNARDLHGELAITKPFTQWMEVQIRRADLDEEKDFIVFNQKVKNPSGGRPEKVYILSMDAAKHIAMMSQSKKAKEIRDYFIDVERKYIKMLKQQIEPSPSLYKETVKRHGMSYDTVSLNVYGMEQRVAKASTGDAIFIALRPLILALGLDWEIYRKKVKVYGADKYEYVPFRTKGGVQEMLSLTIYQLPEFLADISIDRIKKHIRKRILTYGKEIIAVLNEYWGLCLALPAPKPKVLPVMTSQEMENMKLIEIEKKFIRKYDVDAEKFSAWLKKMDESMRDHLIAAASYGKTTYENSQHFLELSHVYYKKAR